MASPQTIQPSGADTFLLEASPTTNLGTSTDLRTSPLTGSRYRLPCMFDFSAVIPAGATVTLARFSIYASYSTLTSRTITVYRLLRTDWVETQATWNIYKTGSNWGTAGALNTSTDITTTDAATATSVAANNWLVFTVTAQVQTALDSVSGLAHFLMADTGASANGWNGFYSREYAITDRCPKLYIEYTEPSAIKTVNGLAIASVKTLRSSVLIASGKTWNGLA
jgi:hypothetical protein